MISNETAPLGAGLQPTSAGAITRKDIEKHLDHYVFCLEDINLEDRQLSVRKIYRGRITRLSDITIQVLDMSEEALTREGTAGETFEEHSLLTTHLKTAWDQALELYINYAQRGLVILESLTGAPPAKVKAAEEYLLANVPISLEEFRNQLLSMKLSVDVTGQAMEKLRAEFLNCIEKTEAYRLDIVEKAEGEVTARSLPNGVGLNRITSGIRFYADSLGKTLKEDQLEVIAKRQDRPVQVEVPAMDPTAIAAIVAATLEAMKQQKEPEAPKPSKK